MSFADWADAAPWGWVIVGLLLCAAEALAPGAFLLWVGLAAMATGIVDWIHPLDWTWSLVAFAVLVVAAVLAGRRLYGGRDTVADRPFLNRRVDALVGQEFVLDQPIENGAGRIRVDDTVWRVAGSDAPAGARVRVTGCRDGVLLRVERA